MGIISKLSNKFNDFFIPKLVNKLRNGPIRVLDIHTGIDLKSLIIKNHEFNYVLKFYCIKSNISLTGKGTGDVIVPINNESFSKFGINFIKSDNGIAKIEIETKKIQCDFDRIEFFSIIKNKDEIGSEEFGHVDPVVNMRINGCILEKLSLKESSYFFSETKFLTMIKKEKKWYLDRSLENLK